MAVGLASGDISMLNISTGSCVAVLSGHSHSTQCVTFSSDGALLASGSTDKTVKLWDVQTGGIVKTFSGHTEEILSIFISAESTIIASGSLDGTILLWNTQTGVCQQILKQQKQVDYIYLYPIEPHRVIFRSGFEVTVWDVNGDQIGESFKSHHIAVSLDGSRFALCNEDFITVQNTTTRAIMAKFHVAGVNFQCCCLSPDGMLVAGGTDHGLYVWETTSSNPHPIETFKGHFDQIYTLTFSPPSSLISASSDYSVKFWQICPSPTEKTEAYIKDTPHKFTFITLQAKEGVTITSDADGVVKVWDISTGLCKETFQTPAEEPSEVCAQLIGDRVIIAWSDEEAVTSIHIWDTTKTTVIETAKDIDHLRISEDGSRVFCFFNEGIEVFSIQTGEVVGEVWLNEYPWFHTIDGCRVWVDIESGFQGWDFSTPTGSLPIQLTNIPPSKLHPCGAILWDTVLFRVQDIATGKVVFQLAKGFKEPVDAQWNGQYLVVCFGPTDILLLDFGHMLLKQNSVMPVFPS